MNISYQLARCLTASLRLVLLGTIWLVAPPLYALDPSRSVTQYVRTEWEDRLPHNTVRAILQSRDGFLWVGTYEGLVRFDGYDFTVFDTRNSALTSGAISAITEDSSGTLWVGTAGGGLYRFDGRTMSPVSLGGQLGMMVSALASDTDGTVWVATRQGLGRIRGGKVEVFGAADGVPRELIWAMRMTGPGELWVATEGGGLFHYRSGRFETLTTADGLSSNVIYSIARGRGGQLWVGTSAGVDILDGERFRSALPAGSLLSRKPAFALLEDKDSNLWVSGGNSGLCRLSANTLTCEPASTIGTDLIRTFAEDREGNLWVGGTHRGLWQLRDGKLTTTTGVDSTNHIRSVTEDASGNIWVGTDGSGVNLVRDGLLVAPPWNKKLPSTFVRSVHSDSEGNLWVGTIEGLARVRDGDVQVYRTAEGLSSNIVYALMKARDGTIWIGTSAGLNRHREGRIESLTFDGDVRALLEDRSGRLWLGRRDGLSCLDRGKITNCDAPPALASATIFGFHESDDGAIWIGTNRGVTRLKDGRFKTFSTRDGLFDQNVFAIVEDERGLFWMTSNKGLWSVPAADFAALSNGTIRALRSTAYGKGDGMGSAQCNGASQPAGWKGRDGRLWFPTAKGVVTVDPTRIRPNVFPPPVVVVKVIVDSRVLDPVMLKSVAPDADRFEFHYAGLSFVTPERVRFRYKLDGYDRQWVEAGTRRVAYYTNLPAGDLRFMVMASNSDGVFSKSSAMTALAIEPHIYETVWFRALVGCALLGALFGAYRLRVRNLEGRERQLVKLVDERTEALRAANAALERLAGVDGLTRIPNRRSLDSRLLEMWNDHVERRAPLSVILCDVDHFKRFNDSNGHLAGDEALVSVAQTIDYTLRSNSDFAARYGGEEFVVLLGDTDVHDATDFGELLLARIRDLKIPHDSSPTAKHVTMSCGAASMIPSARWTPEEFLIAADEALYRAKAAGRDRIEGPQRARPRAVAGNE